MSVLLTYLFVAVVVATWTAWLAERHGRNFWVYFTFTALFPLAAVVAVPFLLLTPRVERP